jgi:hypothetical protein
MSHDSRGALLKKGDRVLVEFELTDDPTADEGYCNANCTAVVPEQTAKPPMVPPHVVFNTRMLTKVGALVLWAVALCTAAGAQQTEGQADQVDAAEIARWGDRVVVAGEGPRDSGELLFSQAMAPPEDDSDQWYITVWGSSRDANSLGVVKGFERDPNLTIFTAAAPGKRPWAHFNFYQAEDRTQRFRFQNAKMAGPWPIITVQPPRSGNFGDPSVVIDRIDASQIGKPADLKKRIQASVDLWCKRLQQTAHVDKPGGHQQLGPVGGDPSFPWGPDVPPAVPTIQPQWPSGGPAADTTPTSATLAQLRACCPGAPAEFLMAQLDAKATVEQAQAAFLKFLQPKVTPVPATNPQTKPAAPASDRPLLQILALLMGSSLIVSIAMPFVQSWATKAKTTPSPFDDIVSGFVLEALKSRLNSPSDQAR